MRGEKRQDRKINRVKTDNKERVIMTTETVKE